MAMQRLVIAIDCDDVLIDSTSWIIDEYNRRYGTSVDLRDAFVLDERQFGANRMQVFERFNELYSLKEFGEIQPRADAIEVVNRLGKKHDLHLVTARHFALELVTLQMLNKYFPNQFVEINHVGEESKGQVCSAVRADVIIDDNAKHLKDAKSCGVKERIWFGAYPWQEYDGESAEYTTRCVDWFGVERVVNQLAGLEAND